MSEATSFWARRKAGVAAEARAQEVALEEERQTEAQAAFDNMSDQEVLDALDLPNPDSLRQGDDFTAFMAKAVPEHIRRRALRTLWRSNPVLANVDMLVDYGEDFTDSALAVENLQTAYQVGKGMMKHVEEMARQAALKEEAEQNPPLPQDETAEALMTALPEEQEDESEAVALTEADSPAVGHEDPDPFADDMAQAPPLARRMKFRIEETA